MLNLSRGQFHALIAAIFLMLGNGIFNYVPAYFMESVVDALGCSRMAYSVHTSIVSITAVLTAPFFGRLIKDMRSLRRMISIGAIVGLVSYALISRISGIWGLYLLSLLLGFVANNCTIVCAVTLLSFAFPENSGTPTGIAMSGTGICNAITSLFLPAVIESQGWRVGYLIVAGLWATMLIISRVAANDVEDTGVAEKSDSGTSIDLPGATYQQAMRSSTMFIFTAVVLVVSINMVFLQHMPAFFGELGYSPVDSGRFMSLFSISIVFAKIAVGTIYDKLGSKKTTIICCIAFAVGMWVQLWSGGRSAMLSTGIMIVVFGHTTCSVLFPLLTKQLFGPREYASIWSYFSGCVMMGYALGTPIWGAIYDALGSYRPAVFIFPFTVVLCGIVILALLKKQFDW